MRRVGFEPTRISPFDLKSNVMPGYTTRARGSLHNLSSTSAFKLVFNLHPDQMAQIIYCFNNSTALTNNDMNIMITALNTLLPAFCAAWAPGGQQWRCQAAPTTMKSVKTPYCVFMDKSDYAGALAYHTETNNVPFGRVFVKTIMSYGGAIHMGKTTRSPTVAQAFSHEIFEIIGNQNVNIWWQSSSGNLVPGEVCDAVQGNLIPIKVGTVTVGLSDYILPVWADPQANKGPYNYMNTLTRPFQIAKGGYTIVMRNGSLSQVLGSSVVPYTEYLAAAKLKKCIECTSS
jgi:hypothetical protein